MDLDLVTERPSWTESTKFYGFKHSERRVRPHPHPLRRLQRRRRRCQSPFLPSIHWPVPSPSPSVDPRPSTVVHIEAKQKAEAKHELKLDAEGDEGEGKGGRCAARQPMRIRCLGSDRGIGGAVPVAVGDGASSGARVLARLDALILADHMAVGREADSPFSVPSEREIFPPVRFVLHRR